MKCELNRATHMGYTIDEFLMVSPGVVAQEIKVTNYGGASRRSVTCSGNGAIFRVNLFTGKIRPGRISVTKYENDTLEITEFENEKTLKKFLKTLKKAGYQKI